MKDKSNKGINMPKVSAVMALYNTPFEYLEKTVDSILNQTFKDFEFIIIDDCSTIDYSEYFNNKDERIKYIKSEQNKGPGYSRNKGIEIATGDYIAIFDSDDVYYPERLEKQVAYLDSHPDISITGAAFKQSNNNKICIPETNTDAIKLKMLFNSQITNPAVMFRKDDFKINNLQYCVDYNFAEDYKLWLDAMFCGLKIANLSDVLFIYTRRKGQLSKKKSETQKEILKIFYNDSLKKLNIDTDYSELMYNIDNQKFNMIEENDLLEFFKNLKNTNFFDVELLRNFENEILENFKKKNGRLLKIKIGNKNLCMNKNLKIYLENRN